MYDKWFLHAQLYVLVPEENSGDNVADYCWLAERDQVHTTRLTETVH